MEDFYSFIRPLLQNCYFAPDHRKQEIEELTMAFEKYDTLKLCHFRIFHAINLPQTRRNEVDVDEAHMKTSHKTNSRPRRNSLNETETYNWEENPNKIREESHVLGYVVPPPRKRQRLNDGVEERIESNLHMNKEIVFVETPIESSDINSNSITSSIIINNITPSETNNLEFKGPNEETEIESNNEMNNGEGVSGSTRMDQNTLIKDINSNTTFKMEKVEEQDVQTMNGESKPTCDISTNAIKELTSDAQVVVASSLINRRHINNHKDSDLSTIKTNLAGSKNENKELSRAVIDGFSATRLQKRAQLGSIVENLPRIPKVTKYFCIMSSLFQTIKVF